MCIRDSFYTIAKVMRDANYNIATIYLNREHRAGDTVIVIETDIPVDGDTIAKIQGMENIIGVVAIEKF